jgi:hypothetical protein
LTAQALNGKPLDRDITDALGQSVRLALFWELASAAGLSSNGGS